MLVQQFPCGPKTVLVDKPENGDQLLQLIFQRRAGEHHGVGTVDAFQRAGSDGVPVLDPLRLVDDDQFRRPGGDQIEVRLELSVIGDLAEVIDCIILLALDTPAGNDAGVTAGKTRNFTLPLVLERCWADHQYFRYAEIPGQDFSGSNGLDRLAQTHFVSDQRPARTYGKQGALSPVWVQRHLEQLFHLWISDAAREQVIECKRSPFGIAAASNEVEGVAAGAQFVATL